MNERVRELAEQAIASLVHKPFSMEQFHEKFAELLLAEVGQHLTNRGLDHAREVIEKEFGI